MKEIYCCLIVFLIASGVYATPDRKGSNQHTLRFRENVGQVLDQNGNSRSDIQFQLVTPDGLSVFVGKGQIHYQWNEPEQVPHALASQGTETRDAIPLSLKVNTYRLDVTLLDANPDAFVQTEDKFPDEDIYYGNDMDGKRAASYQKIIYRNIYPHIDWVLYTKDGHLKYDFMVHPGGKVEDIRIRYDGATELRAKDGAVQVSTPMGSITEQKPYSYTKEQGVVVPSAFVVKDNVLRFDIGDYEGTLVIDPVVNVAWATYYGGIGSEISILQYSHFSGTSYFNPSVVVDLEKNVFLYGTTTSRDNIATTGSHLVSIITKSSAFISKLNAGGERIWASYYGDESISESYSGNGKSVACDAQGNLYIAGTTTSKTGIATKGGFQDQFGGWRDLFLAKFDKDGKREWSTYYGTDRPEYHGSVAVSPDGSKIFLAGCMEGQGLYSIGAYFPFINGGSPYPSGFLACFDRSGNRLWGTFVQPTEVGAHTVLSDIALDPNGNVFVCGTSFGDGGAFFPSDRSIASFGSFQSVNSTAGMFGRDAFLQKWDGNGNRLWGTFYGGERQDYGTGVACDDKGNVYLTGLTQSKTSFIHGDSCVATKGSFQTVLKGENNAFVVKFDGGGSRQWGTYIGLGQEFGSNLVYSNGSVFVTGGTYSANLADDCAYQKELKGTADAFIAMMDENGQKKEITYYGGENVDMGFSLAATEEDGHTVIYFTGETNSHEHIAFDNLNPVHKEHLIGNSSDYFLAKLVLTTKRKVESCFVADSLLLRPWYPGTAPYQWSNGTVADSLWAKTSGQYIVSYDFRPGCRVSDTIDVSVYPLPVLRYTDSACINEQGKQGAARTDVSGFNSNVYQYDWSDAAGNLLGSRESVAGDSIDNLAPGNYSLHIKTPLCDTILQFSISEFPAVTLTTGNDTTIAAGQQIQLWAKGEGVDSFVWFPSKWLDHPFIPNPVSQPQAPVTYTVFGFNIHGCYDSATIRIDVREDLFVPNAFSPNDDGHNDVFKVLNGGYRKLLEFNIFNRWGDRVFSANNGVDQGWDGVYQGKPADVGVYHYYIKTLLRDKIEVFRGDITLIR